MKKIALIGDMNPHDVHAGWTSEGRYRVGSNDTLEQIAVRYTGARANADHLWGTQPEHVRKGGFRPGIELVMPREAIERATALGFIGDRYESEEPVGSLAPGNLVIFPADVDAEIRIVDSEIAALQAAVNAGHLDDATLAAWKAFAASWAAFDKNVSILPARYLQQYHQVVDFEQKARAWEPVLVQHGAPLVSPSIQPPEHPAVSAASSAIKYIAIAAVILGVAYVAAPALGIVKNLTKK